MHSTMQDGPLTITALMRHGARIHAGSQVITFEGDRCRRAGFAEVAGRAAQLAGALRRLGIKPGDRVGTFCPNIQEHQEAYLAVPALGAVLHTLNLRLFPDHLRYIINHADDRAIIVHGQAAGLLTPVIRDVPGVKHWIVAGDDCAGALPGALRYEQMLAAEPTDFDWPDLDERSPVGMCYTSGTTGNPKGVVYSHRSTYLHALAECTGNAFGLTEHDRVLAVPSMFHAHGWGLPYSAWLSGADLLLPGRFVQGEPLAKLIAAERPTVSAGVPTVWADVLRYVEAHPTDLSSLRLVVCAGSAVPRSLIERYQQRHGVRIVQLWGMTETSPYAAIARPPRCAGPDRELDYRAMSGRVGAGIELRIVDNGRVQPWDGQSAGEIQVRGPWVTGSYYGVDASDRFDDGWLRTGDVGTVDALGYIRITDRSKDVIKSGGEWISSVELENEIMAHPDVVEAAVIGVPDPRWDERPLACVVLRQGANVDAGQLREFLAGRVVKWWLPERWAFLPEIPKTSVGKFDKKVLRTRREAGELAVIEIGRCDGK